MAKVMSDQELVDGLNTVLRELDARRQLKGDVEDMIFLGLTTYFEDEIKNVDEERKIEVITFVCPYCNTEIEVEFLEDIVECPNCGETVSKETAGGVCYNQGEVK